MIAIYMIATPTFACNYEVYEVNFVRKDTFGDSILELNKSLFRVFKSHKNINIL